MIISEFLNFLKQNDNSAYFSECRRYRYALWRKWDKTKPFIMFVGLNPSIANEKENDRTISRVIGFAKSWGFGGVFMTNCFPFVSQNPSLLNDYNNIEINDLILKEVASICSKEIVFAWGNFDVIKKKGRDLNLLELFPDAKVLAKNKNGTPKHPLYSKGDIQRINYR